VKVTRDTRRAFELALAASVDYLSTFDGRPVQATASLDDLRRRLHRSLPAAGLPAEDVVRDLIADVKGGLNDSAGGRFFAWVIGGALPAAVAADWLTSAWDQNAGMFTVSPAAAVVEEQAGAWIKDLLGLPAAASFALVTGGQMANTTGLAAARYRVLSDRGWNVERQGLWRAPAVRVLTGERRHATIARSLRLLGMGTDCIVDLPLDADGRLPPERLEEALSADPDAPTIVLLQAGEVNTGTYDDFTALIPLARRHGAWVHVDGAFGLWAAVSPRLRGRLAGVDAAQSWATDGHKWLNVPYDCGYAIVADADAHRHAMSQSAAYLLPTATARDQVDWNPEFSRRARGFATYAAIRQLGRDGIADMVERCCRHAHALATGIGGLPGAELVWEPTINQGLVRFPDPRAGASGTDDDRHTEQVIAGLVSTGEAFFGPTTWRGRRCMRISVSSWQTSDDDVGRAIEAARIVIEASRRELGGSVASTT
jgi:glutamate/tyrosine decarboxylase-like PLP-dependent enzyme